VFPAPKLVTFQNVTEPEPSLSDKVWAWNTWDVPTHVLANRKRYARKMRPALLAAKKHKPAEEGEDEVGEEDDMMESD
jgi:hypothetical protein